MFFQEPPRYGGIVRPPLTPEQLAAKVQSMGYYANDNLHSYTVGQRGPVLAEDGILHETLEEFVHSPLPPRAVHAKGFGAFGQFVPYRSLRQYTRAGFLQDASIVTPVACRFSLAASNRGTPDTSRNVRGFSVKFYTGEGVFDLLCNHIPVFFVRDAVKFPATIAALSPSPVSNLADPQAFWDFIARTPEAVHMLMWLYSDRGTVKSLQHIEGHSVSTFAWVNAEGKRRYVKYRWLPMAGTEFIDRQTAARIAGENPDAAGQELYETIAAGQPAEYELGVQLMDPGDESKLPYDPLDDTKLWSERDYPLIKVGRLTLNRNPENYLEQVEKLAFSPNNLVDGIELTDDKLLQGRANIYWNAQRYRLGRDFREIPVNRGQGWKIGDLVTGGKGREAKGVRTRSEIAKTDDYSQAADYYRSLDDTGKAHLADNIACELYLTAAETRESVLGHLRRVDEELAAEVAKGMAARKG